MIQKSTMNTTVSLYLKEQGWMLNQTLSKCIKTCSLLGIKKRMMTTTLVRL